MQKDSSIFVAGHRGMVGSAIVRCLNKKGFTRIVTRDRKDLDLLDQAGVRAFFSENQIDYVFLAAAKVGGILANSLHQADFLYENLQTACNVMHSAAAHGVQKLIFLGSSCIYPRLAPQPIREEYLMTGPLEGTNEGYAIAKIAGLKLCEMYQRQYNKRFVSVMPTNLYGPGDNFDPQHSHVIPGMIRRFHEAKIQNTPGVRIWGTGTPRREFLHVDDLADALFVVAERYEEPEPLNIGSGDEFSIADLAAIVKRVVGYPGHIEFDASKPDGTPRKLLDSSRIRSLGWNPSYRLEEGLRMSYDWAASTVFHSEK